MAPSAPLQDAPPPSTAVTLRLLSDFYTDVKPLQALLPDEPPVVREADSDRFRQLVGDTLVASTALTGLPMLSASTSGGDAVDMTEVRCSTLHVRHGDTHPSLAPSDRRPGPAAPLFGTRKALSAGEASWTYRVRHAQERPRARLPSCASPLLAAVRPWLTTLSRSKRATPNAGCRGLAAAWARRTRAPSPTRSSRPSSPRSSGTRSRLGASSLCSLARPRLTRCRPCSIGPDPLIELLSSPLIALFVPLPNACFLQVSGTPVAELKPHNLFKTSASSKRCSRPVHDRARRKRRRKNKAVLEPEEPEEPDEGHDDIDMHSVDVVLVPPSPVAHVFPAPSEPPSRAPSPTKRSRPLGPAVSAPLLGVASIQDAQAASQMAATQVTSSQASPTKRLRPIQSATSVFGGASSEAGRVTKRRKLATLWVVPLCLILRSYSDVLPRRHSANSIVFSRHRMYHNRVASVKGGKPPYGLPPKRATSYSSTSKSYV